MTQDNSLNEILKDIARAGAYGHGPAKQQHPTIFEYHNCYKCHNGDKPCVGSSPRMCGYLHAKND